VTARAARRAPPVVARQQPLLPRQLVGLLPLPLSLSLSFPPSFFLSRSLFLTPSRARASPLASRRPRNSARSARAPPPRRRSSVEIPLVTEGDRPSGQLKHDYSPLAAAKNTPRAFTHTCSRLRSRGVPPFALFSSSSADGDEPFSLFLFFFHPSLSLSLFLSSFHLRSSFSLVRGGGPNDAPTTKSWRDSRACTRATFSRSGSHCTADIVVGLITNDTRNTGCERKVHVRVASRISK